MVNYKYVLKEYMRRNKVLYLIKNNFSENKKAFRN